MRQGRMETASGFDRLYRRCIPGKLPVIFRLALHGARLFSPLGVEVTRLMGLLLAAVTVRFALNGIPQTLIKK